MRDGDGTDRSETRAFGGRILRFDTPAPPETPAGADRGNLLGLFRAWFHQSPEERRRMTRHEARASRIWVGWYRGRREFHALTGRLVNISRGGVLLYLVGPPPEGHTVWLCLGDPDPADCVEAVVLDVRTARKSECAVRLAFREPCPHPFFEAVVCHVETATARREGPPRSSRP